MTFSFSAKLTYRQWRWAAIAAVCAAIAATTVSTAAAYSPVRSVKFSATGMVLAKDGRLWVFGCRFGPCEELMSSPTDIVLRLVSISGHQTPLRVRGVRRGEGPGPLALAPAETVWVTLRSRGSRSRSRILRYTSAGVQTRTFTIRGVKIRALSRGPGNTMWALTNRDQILRVTAKGAVSRFRVHRARTLNQIVSGPDGAMWAAGGTLVVRIARQGTVRRFNVSRLPTSDIAFGSDRHLWLSGLGGFQRLSLNGALSTVALQYQTYTESSKYGIPGKVTSLTRSVRSIARDRTGQLVFTAGLPAADSSGPFVFDTSFGRIDAAGVVHEDQPIADINAIGGLWGDFIDPLPGISSIIPTLNENLWLLDGENSLTLYAP